MYAVAHFLCIMKTCSKCGKVKLESDFHNSKAHKGGIYPSCKLCCKQYQDKYRQKHAERLRRQKRQYYWNNADAVKNTVKKYREKNSNVIRTRKRKYDLERRRSDPGYRLIKNLRGRIGKMLRTTGRKKNKSTLLLLGVGSTLEFMSEMQLRPTWSPEWTWDDYGIKFEIDHIIPLSKWKNPENGMCIENCQPLDPIENRSKCDSMPKNIRPNLRRKWELDQYGT